MLHGSIVELDALDSAAEAELAEVVETEVRFRHPLIRSAVRQTALPAQLHAMYGALAEVVADPERRLWHRAMAAVGPDDGIAQALEHHAASARRRGAITVAAAALERAAALSGDPRRKGERLVRAAEIANELGLIPVARRLLMEAEAFDVGPLEIARLAWLRQMISGDVWSESGAAKTFVTIAEQMRGGGGCRWCAALACSDRASKLVDANPPTDTAIPGRRGREHWRARRRSTPARRDRTCRSRADRAGSPAARLRYPPA